jgi:hypothetical protein
LFRRKIPMAVSPDSQNTLLSFLYHVSYNRSVNRAFHHAPDDVMGTDFNLSTEIRQVLLDLGHLTGILTPADEAARKGLIDKLMGLLGDEFKAGQSKFIW